MSNYINKNMDIIQVFACVSWLVVAVEERAELEKESILRSEVSACLTTAVERVAKSESELQLKLLEKELDIVQARFKEMSPAVDEVKVLKKQSSSNMSSLLQRKGSFLRRRSSIGEMEIDIVSPIFRESVEKMSSNELRIIMHEHESKIQKLKVCFGLLPPPPPPTAQEVEAELNALLKKSKHEAKRKAEEKLEMQRKLIESRCSVSILLRYKGNYEVTASAVINGTLLQQAPDLPDQNAAPPPPDPAKLLMNRLLAAKKTKDDDAEPRFEEGGVLWIALDSPLIAFEQQEDEITDEDTGKDKIKLGKARICLRVHVIEREKKSRLATHWRVEVVEGDGAEWWVRGSSGDTRHVTGDDDGEEGMRLEVCWMGKEVGLVDWVPYRLGMEVEEDGEGEGGPKRTKIVRGSLGNIWRPLYHPSKGARGVRKAVSHGRGHDGNVITKFVMVSSDRKTGTNVMRVQYDPAKFLDEKVEEISDDLDMLSPRTRHKSKLKNLLKSAGVATMISLSLSNNSEEK